MSWLNPLLLVTNTSPQWEWGGLLETFSRLLESGLEQFWSSNLPCLTQLGIPLALLFSEGVPRGPFRPTERRIGVSHRELCSLRRNWSWAHPVFIWTRLGPKDRRCMDWFFTQITHFIVFYLCSWCEACPPGPQHCPRSGMAEGTVIGCFLSEA